MLKNINLTKEVVTSIFFKLLIVPFFFKLSCAVIIKPLNLSLHLFIVNVSIFVVRVSVFYGLVGLLICVVVGDQIGKCLNLYVIFLPPKLFIIFKQTRNEFRLVC